MTQTMASYPKYMGVCCTWEIPALATITIAQEDM